MGNLMPNLTPSGLGGEECLEETWRTVEARQFHYEPFLRRECLNSRKYLAYRKKTERLGRVLGTRGLNNPFVSF